MTALDDLLEIVHKLMDERTQLEAENERLLSYEAEVKELVDVAYQYTMKRLGEQALGGEG